MDARARRRVIRTAGIIAVLALVATSCSAGSDRPPESAQAPGSTAVGLSAPTRLDLGGEYEVGVVALGQDRVAFPYDTDPSDGRSSIVSIDLASRRRTVVARSEFPDGLINFVAVSGDWTVYDDQEHLRGDGDMKTLWRIVAVNGKTHERRLLSTSGDQKDPFVPYVKSHNGYVYWAVAEPDQSARLLLWRPEWSEPHTVLRNAEADVLDLHVQGDSMVYVGPAADKNPDGADCWKVPLEGGTPTALTHSGLVMDCVADDEHVIWADHVDPEVDTPPDGMFFDDPYKLVVQRLGHEPVVVHEGYLSHSFIELFGPYVVWGDLNENTVMTRTDDPNVRRVIRGETAIDAFFSESGRLGIAHYVEERTVLDLYELAPEHEGLAPQQSNP